jgi:tetratricopeptide (TPR) repeat protein
MFHRKLQILSLLVLLLLLAAAVPTRAQGGRCDLTTAADFVDRGLQLQNQGDQARAISDFTCALELEPKNTDALFGRGLSLQTSGADARAERDYTALLEIEPDNPNAYNNRGNIYFSRGELEKAMADYDRAIALDDPQKDITYRNRGNLFYEMDDLKSAIEDYSSALDLNPDYREVYFSRGYAYDELGDRERAAEDFANWLSRGTEIFRRTSLSRLERGIRLEMQETWFYRFAIPATRGQLIRATGTSLTDPPVDSFLFVIDPEGNLAAWADDIPDSLDSLLTYTASVSGTYVVLVTHAGGGSFGEFELTVRVTNTL